jgi:hypothetical protein
MMNEAEPPGISIGEFTVTSAGMQWSITSPPTARGELKAIQREAALDRKFKDPSRHEDLARLELVLDDLLTSLPRAA